MTTTEPFTDRITPWNRDAEESLLGAMMLPDRDATARGLREVVASDFWNPQHAAIYTAIESLWEHGEPVDPVTVHARLVEHGVDTIERREVLRIQAETPASANIGSYATIIRRYSRARAAITLGDDLRTAGYEADLSRIDELGSESTRRLSAGASLDVAVDDLLDLWELDVEERENPTKPWVIPGCLRAGEQFILTGTEGGGKAVYLRQIGACVASGVHPLTGLMEGMDRHRVAYFDLQEDRIDQAAEVGKLSRALASVYERGWWSSVSWQNGVDVLSPVGRRRIETVLEKARPELVLLGPLVKAYRTPDGRSRYGEDVIDEVTATFDEWMHRYGFALMIEAHAGNERGSEGDWRVRGSSVWRSWPAFSHGLKQVHAGPREAEIVRARPDRYDGRAWPTRLFENQAWRYPWQVADGDYERVLRAMGLNHLLGEASQPALASHDGDEPF